MFISSVLSWLYRIAMAFYESQYTYNGLNYNIVDSLEVHEKLGNDMYKIKYYFKLNYITNLHNLK